MSFLAGFVALFAALGAIPIIIHLLNKRRFKIVPWAAMEFLLATIEQNSRRVQMRDLILMALRTLAVVCFALALARPTLAPGKLNLLGHQGEVAAVIVLDCSQSMATDLGDGTRFARAQARANLILDQLPKDSSAALVLLDDAPKSELAEPTHDVALVREDVKRAVVGDGGTDVAAALALAWKIAARAQAPAREIYLVSDLQTVGWPSAEDVAWKATLTELASSRPEAHVFVCDVGDENPSNLCVDDLAAEDELAATEGGGEAAFIATVRSHGAAARDVPVELRVGAPGGEMRKVASTVLDVVDGTRTARLATRFETGGQYRVEVVAGVDRDSADNRRGVVVDVIDQLKVLLIDGSPASGAKKWQSGTFFLQSALSLAAADAKGDDEAKPGARIAVDVATTSDLAGRSFNDYQAIVLANVGDPSPALIDALKTFVRVDGKGLMISLGDNVRAETFNDALFTDAGLAPGKLGELVTVDERQDGATTAGVGFATAGLTHAIVAYLGDDAIRRFLAQPRFQKSFAVTLPGADDPTLKATGDRVAPVLAFADGRPALVERTVGRGSVLMFASAIDRSWSDFPLRPAFLMLMRRSVQHLTLGRRAQTTVLANQPLVAWLPAKDAGQPGTITDPKGERRRVVAEQAPGGIAKLEIDDTRLGGFWRCEPPGESSLTTQRWFAVNHPPRESAPERFADAATLRARTGFDGRLIAPTDDLATIVREKRVGHEIWAPLLALVCVCLALEAFLAQRWAPQSDGGAAAETGDVLDVAHAHLHGDG